MCVETNTTLPSRVYMLASLQTIPKYTGGGKCALLESFSMRASTCNGHLSVLVVLLDGLPGGDVELNRRLIYWLSS